MSSTKWREGLFFKGYRLGMRDEAVGLTWRCDASCCYSSRSKPQDGLSLKLLIEIDSQAIDISGSPLLKEIFSQEGRFELSSNAIKKFTQKMWLQNPNSNEGYQFYDMHGTVVLGKSSITFKGNMCDDLLSIRYRIHSNQIATSKFKLTFRIDLLKPTEMGSHQAKCLLIKNIAFILPLKIGLF
jgi:hypothetical protein